MKIDVLDKGFIQLMRCADSDLDVVNCARVSFGKESKWEVNEKEHHSGSLGGGCTVKYQKRLSERDTKLIHYLARENHWSPFAHPQIRLRVKAPIFVRTQMFKHKQGLVENEVSRRYVDDEPEFYTPSNLHGRPCESIKQGSGEILKGVNGLQASKELTAAYRQCFESYALMKDLGVAPEQARMVLPQSTYTEWIWTGSLAAFARVYNQRSDEHAQWEAQQYAHALAEIIEPLFPVSWEALTNG